VNAVCEGKNMVIQEFSGLSKIQSSFNGAPMLFCFNVDKV